MFWRIVRRRGVIPFVLILAALAYWKLHPRAPKTIEVGYVGERTVTIWNTLAQVRQPVSELHYGDRIEVIRQEGAAAQVRTTSGALGWIADTRQIMNSDLWNQSAALLAKAQAMPVQGRGQTKTVSNVRVKPGRDSERIFQFLRGTPVVILERTIAQVKDEDSAGEKRVVTGEQEPKREDWLLVLGAGDPTSSASNPSATENSSNQVSRASGDPVSAGPRNTRSGSVAGGSLSGPIAGWVLSRFIEPTLPGPVRDYANSADLHVVAWFELNRVPDGSGGEAPQYLVAGSRGGEGQACDFTMLRVYTWGTVRKRYETAYVESGLCGRLPIRVSQGATGPEFRFGEADSSTQRMYSMRQTSVRRVKDASSGNLQLQSKTKRH
jgi:hypothetical protein